MKAGPKNASPMPNTAASAIRCQSSITPLSERAASVAAAAVRTRSAAIMIRRRENRSETTPPRSTKSPSGAVQATPTSESAVGESDSS